MTLEHRRYTFEMIDTSRFPFKDNIARTCQVVEFDRR